MLTKCNLCGGFLTKDADGNEFCPCWPSRSTLMERPSWLPKMNPKLRARCIEVGMPSHLDGEDAEAWLAEGCNFNSAYADGFAYTWEGAREAEKHALEIGLIEPPKYPNIPKPE